MLTRTQKKENEKRPSDQYTVHRMEELKKVRRMARRRARDVAFKQTTKPLVFHDLAIPTPLNNSAPADAHTHSFVVTNDIRLPFLRGESVRILCDTHFCNRVSLVRILSNEINSTYTCNPKLPLKPHALSHKMS